MTVLMKRISIVFQCWYNNINRSEASRASLLSLIAHFCSAVPQLQANEYVFKTIEHHNLCLHLIANYIITIWAINILL